MSEDIADYDCDSDAESCSMSRPSSCASSQDDLDMLVDSSFQVITSKEVVERMNIEIRKASETMNVSFFFFLNDKAAFFFTFFFKKNYRYRQQQPESFWIATIGKRQGP